MVIVTCSVVIGGFFVVAMVLRIRNYIKRTQENYRGRFGRGALCSGSKDSLSKVSDHGKTKKEKIKFKDAFIHMDPHEHFECPDNMDNTPKVAVETHPLLVVTTPPSPIAGSSLDQPHQNQPVVSAVKKDTKHKEPKHDNLVDDKDVDKEKSTLEHKEESKTPADTDKPETEASAISAVPSRVSAPVPPAISMEQIILKSLGHVNVGLTQSETSLNSINPSYRYGNQFEYGSYHGGGIHLPHGHSQSSLQGSDDGSVIHKDDSPPVTEESKGKMFGHETTMCPDSKQPGPEVVSSHENINKITTPAENINSTCVKPVTNIIENNQIGNEQLRNVGVNENSPVNKHTDGAYNAKDEDAVDKRRSKLMGDSGTVESANGVELKNADCFDAHSVLPQGTQVISDQPNIIPPKKFNIENSPSIDPIRDTAGISNSNGLATIHDSIGNDRKSNVCPVSNVGEKSTIGNGKADMKADKDFAEQDRKSGQYDSGSYERITGDLTVCSGNIDKEVLKNDSGLSLGDASKKAAESEEGGGVSRSSADSPALISVEETGSVLPDPSVKGHEPYTKGQGECRLIDLDETTLGPVIGMEDMEDDPECHDPLLEKIMDHQGKSNSESTESLTKQDDKACFLKQLDQMQSTFL